MALSKTLSNFRSQKKKPDFWLAILVFILAFFGVIMVYSASVVISDQLYGYNSYFLNKQMIAFGIGILAWIVFYNIDYRIWSRSAGWMLGITLFFLIAVFVPGIGRQLEGAYRWIDVGPIFFQPAELIKLTFIIYLSAWLAKKGKEVKDFRRGFLPFILITGLIVFLVMRQPDMGTTTVIALSAVAIFFASGASISHMILGLIAAAGGFWLLIKTSAYRLQRFLVFLNPGKETLGAAYHINQALLAIGSGGLLGLGFGMSKQKYLFLPQAQTDSIFAIITEELGFLRAMLVIIVFVLIAWRGYRIAKNAPDNFSRLLAVGITSWIVFQAAINIGAMTGLLPLTGVPLPFVSYGGSSLVVLMAAVGILMNISKQSNH
jgi:cell division protein FtsW